jgi:vacuolar-type H+-ATPase subunit B/Vma2
MINPQQHILHRGLTSIQGPLVFARNAPGVGLYDRVEVLVRDGGESRIGRIVSIAGEHVVVEVFQGTEGLSLGERACWDGYMMVLADPSMVGRE